MQAAADTEPAHRRPAVATTRKPDGPAESALSCNCCRRRKLRCSREMPTCQQCRKTGSECEYRGEKGRPGMKPGAIENLHRRLDQMEQSIENLKARDYSGSRESTALGGDGAGILALLAREVQRLNDKADKQPQERTRQASPGTYNDGFTEHGSEPHRKRRRLDSSPSSPQSLNGMPRLPSQPVLDQIVEAYFSHLQPWIPMLHKARFDRRLDDPIERPKLLVILQAMVVAATKYVDCDEVENDQLHTEEELEAVRNWVIATAMSSLVIESLQALTIIAFNDIGNGHNMKAWPIIGSLTRTVEYLQLTVELDDTDRPSPLSKPYITTALRDSTNTSNTSPSSTTHDSPYGNNGGIPWIELEERRRVFWNIFALDRFCSITMGWNTSLTSDDVCRRLPCDISLWWQDEHVRTPYFNIWDKSAGRIGNPITFLPSHYGPKAGVSSNTVGTSSSLQSASAAVATAPVHEDNSTPSSSHNLSPSAATAINDTSTIGAFAYAVEATESLSQVTTYFLQQRVNMRDEVSIGSWLTRFKELDLRLIHWKMLLPQKWKPDMARRLPPDVGHGSAEQYGTANGVNTYVGNGDGRAKMDPNLTQAHIAHNASIILLHQPIAFPPMEWPFRNRLPTASSAETCLAASKEVASIASNYIETSSSSALPVGHLFAFCLFISARVLLIHWRYFSAARLAPEFTSLVESLDGISERWRGRDRRRVADDQASGEERNLAGVYAVKLRLLRQRCVEDEFFRIDPSGYTTDIGDTSETWEAPSLSQISREQQSISAPSALPPQQAISPRRERLSSVRAAISPRGTRMRRRRASVTSPAMNQRLPNNVTPDAGSQSQLSGTMNGGTNDLSDMGNGVPDQGMSTISHMFPDPQFIDVDRIISLDDGMFDAGYNGMGWA